MVVVLEVFVVPVVFGWGDGGSAGDSGDDDA